MRRLLLFAILFVLMFIPHGVLMNTSDTGQCNEPVLMQDSPAPQAVLMHSPNGVLMHDPSGVLMGDPLSGRTLAIKMVQRKPTELAITFCVRKLKPERPLIVTIRRPLALVLTMHSAVRA